MLHNVKLDVYEGPIELLLDLVRRGDIDICEVSLARIAREYFEYVRLLEAIDLAAAGDFVAMAATLLRFKLRMLLPSRSDTSEALEPVPSLSRDEYLKVKKLAEQLREMELSAGKYFSRPRPVVEKEVWQGEETVSFFDLLSAFTAVLDRERETGLYTVRPVRISVEERMEQILDRLKVGKKVSFLQLFEGDGRMMLVTTFLAVLELIKAQRIRAVQSEPFGPIWIRLQGVNRARCSPNGKADETETLG